jgi:hypothetical protein
MTKKQKAVAAALFGIALIGSPVSAHAECRTLSFSVNDYGKEGPARDAADLLEKYIVRWTGEKGIKKYRKVPKEITCELFLDVVVFDEYTCTASADICW